MSEQSSLVNTAQQCHFLPSPFNVAVWIGEEINLYDFSPQETLHLSRLKSHFLGRGRNQNSRQPFPSDGIF